jgi:hypothetical protein
MPNAGWYDDPIGDFGKQRFWDGQRWTGRERSAPLSGPDLTSVMASPPVEPSRTVTAPIGGTSSRNALMKIVAAAVLAAAAVVAALMGIAKAPTSSPSGHITTTTQGTPAAADSPTGSDS